MRHERFTVVLADVAVRDEAGFTTQVTSELPAVVVLNDDRVARAPELIENRLAMEWDHPADVEMIGNDAFIGKKLNRFYNDTFG
jgi:hypothetical protein